MEAELSAEANAHQGAEGEVQKGEPYVERSLHEVTPFRAPRSPMREALERYVSQRGYRIRWKQESSHGLRYLRLEILNERYLVILRRGVAKRWPNADPGQMAETLAGWAMRPETFKCLFSRP